MNKIIGFTKNILIEYYDLLIFTINLILIDIIFRNIISLGFGSLAFSFDMIMILGCIAILIFIPKEYRKYIECFIVLIIGIYGFAQILHYAYFSTFFSFKKLTVVSELGGVINEVFAKLDIKFFLVFIPFIIQLGLCFIKHIHRDINIIFKLVSSLVCVTLIFTGVYIIDSHLKKDDKQNGWMGDSYLYYTFHNNVRFLDRFGIGGYLYKDIDNTINLISKKDISQNDKELIDSYIENQDKLTKNEMSGIYEDKNIVLVLCESLNNYGINEKLTPTLYKMASDGYYFTNHYAPIYQSATGDSEFISLTSMIPSVDYGTTSYTYHDNSFPYALGNLFKDKGYNVNSYHSFITNFYNRELFHKSLGFDTFYSEEKLGLARFEGYEPAFNWHDDDTLFKATIENTKLDDDQPFFDFVITTSGHMPYYYGRQEIAKNVDEIDKSGLRFISDESKYYLAAQMNLDKGLEVLLDELDKASKLEDTIIILYGDHYPYGLTEKESIKEVCGDDEYAKYKVPLIIYDPTSKGEIINRVSSTFDIYPTIANLFNLDISNAFVVGHDLFSDKQTFVPFMDRSIVTDDFIYNSNNNEIKIYNSSYIEGDELYFINKVNEIFDIGQKILVYDYYD